MSDGRLDWTAQREHPANVCKDCEAGEPHMCPRLPREPAAPLPGVSLDDPDLTRAVAEAIHRVRCAHGPACAASESDAREAEAALAAVRAHLEEVGR